MSSLQDKILETIQSDIKDLNGIDDMKQKRKECSLLLARIESAFKLFKNDKIIINRLENLKNQTQQLKLRD